MGLLSFFRKSKYTAKDSSTYMLEDDFCQIELLPEANYVVVKSDAEKTQEFARGHFTGVGFMPCTNPVTWRKYAAWNCVTDYLCFIQKERCHPEALEG